MADPSAVSIAGTYNPGAAVATGSRNGAMSGTADFQTFLTLLTAQLRNQDPLQPIESTAFVAQLASFSVVEQQVETNALLGEIKGLLGGSAAAFTDWVGQKVLAPVAAQFSGQPIGVDWKPVAAADLVQLTVYDTSGTGVAGQISADNSGTMVWTGRLDSGEIAGAGTYSFRVESFQGGALVGSQAGLVEAEIVGLRQAGNVLNFVFADGSQLDSDDFS